MSGPRVKMCFQCKQDLAFTEYSKRQLRFKDKRCKKCVVEWQSKHDGKTHRQEEAANQYSMDDEDEMQDRYEDMLDEFYCRSEDSCASF